MNYAAFVGMTPLEIFRKIAPQLASYPDDVVQGYLDAAAMMFCLSDYGEYADIADALLAAHMMVIPGGVAYTGIVQPTGVTSMKEGDLSITWGAIGESFSMKTWLTGSSYGQMLMLIRNMLGMNMALMTRGGVRCGSGEYYFPNRVLSGNGGSF